MRGSDMRTGELFSYVDLEERVPRDHPLRLIRRIVNEVLAALDREFAALYATDGRPSIAPERLLRALLLQAFYTIGSERQLMEQLHYNLLYRWFVGLSVDDPVWVPTVFTKNRDEHLSVDGTQVAAWASMKSFVAKDGSGEPPSPGRNGERDFHGERRRKETHASTTDPEAKLAKKGKGKEAKLAYTGNVMTENRNGFVVEAELRQVSGAVRARNRERHDRALFAGRQAHHRGRRQGLRYG
jgi:transposase